MDPLLQKRIQRYGWDKAAEYYELYWMQQLEPAQTKLLEMVALKTGDSVVDIACGSGAFTFRIANSVGQEGRVMATDISDNMVAMASRMASEKKLENVEFIRMDAEALDIGNALYDASICSLGLMYVPDAEKAIREMYRVVKPGGRAIASVWGQRSRCGWADIFPIVESRVKSEVCPLFFQLGSGLTMEKTFVDAGFSGVYTERISTLLHYASAEEACGAAFAGGPVALAYSRFDEKMRKEAFADYLTSIANFKNGEGFSIPGEFVITIGLKDS